MVSDYILCSKVDLPNLVMYLIQTHLSVYSYIRIQDQIPKRYVFKKDWTMCSKHDDCSRLNS